MAVLRLEGLSLLTGLVVQMWTVDVHSHWEWWLYFVIYSKGLSDGIQN